MASKIYVGNLSFDTTNETLQSAFAQCGTVVSATVMMDKFNPTRSRGFGFVEMSTAEEMQAGVEMWNGKELDGRQIVVNEARPLEERPARSSGGFNRGGSRGGGSGFGGGGSGARRGGFSGGSRDGGNRDDSRGGSRSW